MITFFVASAAGRISWSGGKIWAAVELLGRRELVNEEIQQNLEIRTKMFSCVAMAKCRKSQMTTQWNLCLPVEHCRYYPRSETKEH